MKCVNRGQVNSAVLLHTTDNIEDFIVKKNSQLSFTYFTVDAWYGMVRYFISGDHFILCQGQVMESLQSAVRYNRFHPHMDSRPSVLKKRLLRKKTKFHSCDTNAKLWEHRHRNNLSLVE